MSNICRVCLTSNGETHSINSSLQVLYEKLTNKKLLNEDGRPTKACFICCWKLAQCYRFRNKFHKSTAILNQLRTHQIEIVPETISILNRGIQHEYLVTAVENFTYGSQFQKFAINKVIKDEVKEVIPIESAGIDEKLCLVCLSLSSRTYCELGSLEDIYEKLTDYKLKITNALLGVCFLCRAKVRSCKETVTKAIKSERIIDELAKNGIQLTQETVTILNKKFKSSYVATGIETFSYIPRKEIKQIDKNNDKIATVIKQEPIDRLSDQDSEKDQNATDSNGSENEADPNNDPVYESEQNSAETDENSDHSDQEKDSNENSKGADGEINITCKFCGYKIKSNYRLKLHMPLHDPSKKFACSICTYRYKSKIKLQNHMRVHNCKLECEKCGKEFKKLRILQRHMHTHGKRIYKCEICNKTCNRGAELTQHNKLKHPNVRHYCKFCDEQFRFKERLYDHVFSKHANDHSYFTCDYCRKQFASKALLRKHIAKIHTKRYAYKCSHCPVTFVTSKSLAVHAKVCMQKEKIQYKCTICHKSYFNKFTLIYHMRTHNTERPFECEICEHSFKTEYALKVHLRIHTGLVYKCEFCYKIYSNKHCYKAHVRAHTTGIEKPFECNKCIQTFRHKSALKRHEIKHHSNTVYTTPHSVCSICDKRVKYLQQHMKCHREKALCCDICDMKFRLKSNLIVHIKTHTRLKPFECNDCGKRFTLKRGLVNHLKLVHTERVKTHECKVCDKLFYTEQLLKVHQIRHAGRAFQCDECFQEFIEARDLKVHTFLKHRNDYNINVICDLCNNVFRDKAELIKHLKNHKGTKHHRCELCEKRFKNLHSLFWHTRTHKPEEFQKTTCKFCYTVFSSNMALAKHYAAQHNGYKNFGCNICEVKFNSFKFLSIHIDKEHDVTEYKCPWCFKTFCNRKQLCVHTKESHKHRWSSVLGVK